MRYQGEYYKPGDLDAKVSDLFHDVFPGLADGDLSPDELRQICCGMTTMASTVQRALLVLSAQDPFALGMLDEGERGQTLASLRAIDFWRDYWLDG